MAGYIATLDMAQAPTVSTTGSIVEDPRKQWPKLLTKSNMLNHFRAGRKANKLRRIDLVVSFLGQQRKVP